MTIQTVPLVVYTNGARREIGEAEVNLETGEVSAIVTDKDAASIVSVNLKTSLSVKTVEVEPRIETPELEIRWPPLPGEREE